MEEDNLKKYNKILKKYWNYPSLKPEQYRIISTIIDGRDVCAVLATGFGKSICYQLPTLICKKCVIVVSPLIALMHEQSIEMKTRDIPVAVFNSSITETEKEEIKKDIIDNSKYVLIYMTPEYVLHSKLFLKNLVLTDNLALVCVDEAHAVSTWGLDFRASYTKLNVIREWIPSIPILTLTATASTKVKVDIKNILLIKDPYEVIGNFDRPNLFITVKQRSTEMRDNIGALLTKYQKEYIIIYCKTRVETEELAIEINKFGLKCEAYHAGIIDKKRNDIHKRFIDGINKCIIATIAFGMGINIPNVRLVIHYNCPKNMESYYQEIGRAGRDGLYAECCLFYSTKDFVVNRLFLRSITDIQHKTYQEDQIRLIEKYVYSTECRRKSLLKSFGQNVESCVSCDNCLSTSKNIKIDYSKQLHVLLKTLYKIDDKFGCGMLINVLLGNSKKVKEYMTNFEEFGSGFSFGNENWWKSFVRLCINNDYVEETQIKGSFGSTLCLKTDGLTMLKKLNKLTLTDDDSKSSKSSKSSSKIMFDKIILEEVRVKPTKTPKPTPTPKPTKTSINPTVPALKEIKIIPKMMQNKKLTHFDEASNICDMLDNYTFDTD